MQGRKPSMGRIIPMRPDAAEPVRSPAAREKEFKKQALKTAKKLMPEGLSEPVHAKWLEYAPLLAHPTLDRLKPHFVFAMLELCKTMAWIEEIDAELDAMAARMNTTRIAVSIYRVKGRNGEQMKSNPLIPQRNEAVRQLWHWMDEFGLTPAAEERIKNRMENGQSDLFDPQTKAHLDAINKVSKYVR